MQIVLNGKPYILSGENTVTALVKQLELENRRIAVELNQDIVLRSEYASTRLQAGDQVEIVHAIGGG